MTALDHIHFRTEPGLFASKPGLFAAALFALLYLKLMTAFSYHLGIFGSVSYAIDGLLMTVLALALLFYQQRLTKAARLSAAGLMAFTLYLVIQGGFYGRLGETVTYYTRFVLPLLLYFGLLLCSVNHPVRTGRLTENLCLLVFALGFAGLFFMPENFNHGDTKLPTYFSGLHKSSYIFSVALVVAAICYPGLNRQRRVVLLGLGGFAVYMLLFGWAIRTSLMLLLVYCAALWALRRGVTGRTTLFLLAPVGLVALALVSSDSVDWNRVSSGRLTMWQAKLDMLYNANVPQLVFGRGYGSDYIAVPGWFGDKDSHNNYLQTITELGLVGLLLLLANLVLLYRVQPNRHTRALVLGYAATGLLSNGIIYRLLPGYLFAAALAYLALRECRYVAPYPSIRGRP